jgi:GT2 family glycosyltransferase
MERQYSLLEPKREKLSGSERVNLSVIIVNWNTRDLLQKCLFSLYQHTKGISFEVFVVDNGSADGSPEMVGQLFPSVHLIRNTENLGFSKANNQAICLTSSRYVLLLNSDTELTSNVLQEVVLFMDNHPSVGISGTRLLNEDGTLQYSCDLFPRTPLKLLCDKIADICYPGSTITRKGKIALWNYSQNFAVDYLIGAMLLIRRETLDQIGLLDEQFFMYAEDIDWCYRAALAGWETYYLGEISICHYNRGSSEKTPEVSSYLQTLRDQSLLKFYKKHYGVFAAFILNIIIRLKRGIQI